MAQLRATTRNGHNLLFIERTPTQLKWKMTCCGWWLYTDHDGRCTDSEYNILTIQRLAKLKTYTTYADMIKDTV